MAMARLHYEDGSLSQGSRRGKPSRIKPNSLAFKTLNTLSQKKGLRV